MRRLPAIAIATISFLIGSFFGLTLYAQLLYEKVEDRHHRITETFTLNTLQDMQDITQ